MVVVDVGENGVAPSGLRAGDYVNTAGGMYLITDPGSWGSVYNPNSGYWSVKSSGAGQVHDRMYELYNQMTSSARDAAAANSLLSQQFAENQMAFQAASAERAMQFSGQQAEINRNWQEMMSNTAHQREVKDLLAAGLNPVLSAHSSGASTPSGASASGVTSPGASGSVDNSYQAIASNLLQTMINADKDVDIAELYTKASILSAQINSNAQLTSTILNAKNQWNMQERQQEYDAWKTRNYPGTIPQAAGTIVDAVNRFLTNKSPTANNLSGLAYNLGSAVKTVVNFMQNKGFHKGFMLDENGNLK